MTTTTKAQPADEYPLEGLRKLAIKNGKIGEAAALYLIDQVERLRAENAELRRWYPGPDDGRGGTT